MISDIRAEVVDLLQAFGGALANGFEGPDENWDGYERRVGIVLAYLELETEQDEGCGR